MARAKLKFRLHRAVIVLICLALLVALMQGGIPGLARITNDSVTRSLRSWPGRWRAGGDAQRCAVYAHRNAG